MMHEKQHSPVANVCTSLMQQSISVPTQADVQQTTCTVSSITTACNDVNDSMNACPTLSDRQSKSHTSLGHTLPPLLPCETETSKAAVASSQHDDVNSTHSTRQKVYVPQAGDVEVGPQQCGVLRRKPGKVGVQCECICQCHSHGHMITL
jgi:hypothetical protein